MHVKLEFLLLNPRFIQYKPKFWIQFWIIPSYQRTISTHALVRPPVRPYCLHSLRLKISKYILRTGGRTSAWVEIVLWKEKIIQKYVQNLGLHHINLGFKRKTQVLRAKLEFRPKNLCFYTENISFRWRKLVFSTLKPVFLTLKLKF